MNDYKWYYRLIYSILSRQRIGNVQCMACSIYVLKAVNCQLCQKWIASHAQDIKSIFPPLELWKRLISLCLLFIKIRYFQIGIYEVVRQVINIHCTYLNLIFVCFSCVKCMPFITYLLYHWPSSVNDFLEINKKFVLKILFHLLIFKG